MAYRIFGLIMDICFVGLGLCFVVMLLGTLPNTKKVKRKKHA